MCPVQFSAEIKFDADRSKLISRRIFEHVVVRELKALNVYTSQNPRRHVVFIEIQPNAYYKYMSQTAEPVVRVTIWRINREVVHGQYAVSG